MKRYTIRVNCPSFLDIEVEADTHQEAIEIAEHQFACPASSAGEFCEILHIESALTHPNEEEGRK